MNKKLIYILLVLIPITIISFLFKETNFIMLKKQQSVDKIKIKLDNSAEKIELEEYIIGVVAGEMPALFEEEALKAQAIASRSYLISHLENNESISPTTDDQVYLTVNEMKEKWQKDFDEYYNKIKKAVNNTKGLIMYYDKKPIKAYYFSTSNGYTESSLNVFNEHQEYLTIVESPFEDIKEQTITLTIKDLCHKLDIPYTKPIIKDIKKDNSNRISSITINNKTFKGTEIRKKLSLRSTDFSLKIENEIVKITTRGYGHGVGMSQYGANSMAKKGYTYEEILKYYYKGIEINSI